MLLILSMDLEELIIKRDKLNVKINKLQNEKTKQEFVEVLQGFLFKKPEVLDISHSERTDNDDPNMVYHTYKIVIKYKKVKYYITIKMEKYCNSFYSDGYMNNVILMEHGSHKIELGNKGISDHVYGIYKLPSELILQTFCILIKANLINKGFNLENFEDIRINYIMPNENN